MPRDETWTGSLRRFCISSSPDDSAEALVDEQTWSDLDMDAVFARIDRTASVPGRMILYRLLRSPPVSIPTLSERDALIEALGPARQAARPLRDALGHLDRTAGAEDLASLLWEQPPAGLPHAWSHRILALLAVASVPLALSVGGPTVFAPLLAFTLNAAIHFRTRLRWQREIQALRFVGSLRSCARRVASLSEPLLGPHQRRLAAALEGTAPLARRVRLLSAAGIQDILYEYLSIFLLLELQAYQWLVRHWRRAAPALRDIFVTLGELDALASVGQWRAGLATWCRPDLTSVPPHLEIAEGVHPLLDDPVANSISLTARGSLVTGANMSGKSTLLRTLGINALLAQTMFTCTARQYCATPLRILSSMRVGDDVLAGKSRYLAEAERLLTLVRRAASGEPTLCLVDELLSGTNASERLAASRAILDHLAARGLLVVAATHDLELTDSLKERYDSYFFAADFSRDDLHFDYRLQPGVATTRNAIRLLERLGYPRAIIDQARGSLR
jgi:hypothetical protein